MKHNSLNQIIEALIAARKRKNLSQSELGRRLGLPQSYISRLESGQLDFRLTSLIDIARFLELELVLIPQTMAITVQALTASEGKVQEDSPLYSLDDIKDEN